MILKSKVLTALKILSIFEKVMSLAGFRIISEAHVVRKVISLLLWVLASYFSLISFRYQLMISSLSHCWGFSLNSEVYEISYFLQLSITFQSVLMLSFILKVSSLSDWIVLWTINSNPINTCLKEWRSFWMCIFSNFLFSKCQRR